MATCCMSMAASLPACDAALGDSDIGCLALAYQTEKWAPELKRFVDEPAPAR